MSWFILGIDIGYSGFACLKRVGSNRVQCIPTPVTSPPILRNVLDTDNQVNVEDYDMHGLLRITQAAAEKSQGCCVAVMEQPFAKKTSNKAVTSLLRSQAYWAAACALADIPAFYLDASSWKARIGIKQATSEIRDRTKRSEASKALAVKIANELVSNLKFHSHDAAEAFLLAYCLENFYEEKFGWLKDDGSAQQRIQAR